MTKFDTRWGYWIEHFNVPKVMRIKTLVINHGKSISYQYHEHRDEHWKVIEGYGILYTGTVDTNINEIIYFPQIQYLQPGTEFVITKYTAHKVIAFDYNEGHFTNLSAKKGPSLVISETQYGEICSEEDIIRLENINE